MCCSKYVITWNIIISCYENNGIRLPQEKERKRESNSQNGRVLEAPTSLLEGALHS